MRISLSAISGYIQDLKQEEAEMIRIRIKQCQPERLSIFGNELKSQDLKFFQRLLPFLIERKRFLCFQNKNFN